KDRGDGLGHFANRFSLLVRAANDLVVDVSQVHDLTNLPSAQLERAPQKVDKEEGAKIPEVRRVVDRRAATIDAHRLAVRGGKRLRRAGQGVEESKLTRRGPPNGLGSTRFR